MDTWLPSSLLYGMMGKITEEMAGVMRVATLVIRERQKQQHRRHSRNEGPWEINFGEERGDDGNGVMRTAE